MMKDFGGLQRVAKIFYYVATLPPSKFYYLMEKLKLGLAQPKNLESIINCC